MIDLSKTIEAKSDQLNADDLIGGSKIITITSVKAGDKEQPVAIHYEGDNGKPWKPCKTMRRVLCSLWTPSSEKYIGQKLVLYRDASVTFGGMEVGGIRISHATGIDKNAVLILAATKKTKKPLTIKPLIEQQIVQKTPEFNLTDEFLKLADTAALKGVQGYKDWWINLSDAQRDAMMKPIVDENGEIGISEHEKMKQMAASVDSVAQTQTQEVVY